MMEPLDIKCPASGRRCTQQCWDGQCKSILSPESARRIEVPDPWAIKPEKQMVYTILWYYSDKSDFGLLEVAFRKYSDAEDLQKILEEHSGTKQFLICQSVLKS
jgi:hypothetical protein